MANFASLRGPVGLNRVYVKVPNGPLDVEPWLANLKQGRTFATNGPLLGFSLGQRQIGDDLRLQAGTHEVKFTAWLRSIVPVDRVQVVCNGGAKTIFPGDAVISPGDVQGVVTDSQGHLARIYQASPRGR